MPQVLIAHQDKTLASRLNQALKNQGYQSQWVDDVRAASDRLVSQSPDVLIMSDEFVHPASELAMARLRNAPRTTGMLILVVVTNDTDARVRALEAGADGYLVLPVDERELISSVRSLLERAERLKRLAIHEPGKVITFFSAKGGVGTTSICVNTAASLTKVQPSARVVCVDLALPLGSVGDLLGLEPKNTIAGLSSLKHTQLDPLAVSEYLTSRPGLGFDTLLGARDLTEAQQVNPDTVQAVLHHLQGFADYILVDIGRNVSRISLPVVKQSHRVVMILSTDAMSLRLNQVAFQYFTSLGIMAQRLVLIVNRAVGREGKSVGEAEELMKHAILTTVPYERDRFTIASNMGVPLVQKEPDCPAALSLLGLAQQLL